MYSDVQGAADGEWDTHAKLTDLRECAIRMGIRCEDCEYEQLPKVLLGNGHAAVRVLGVSL